MKRHFLLFGVVALGLAAPAAEPTVRHFTCPVNQLELLKGELPPSKPGSFTPPTVRLDGAGEVELVIESEVGDVKWSNVFVAVRTAEKKPATGTLAFGNGEKRSVVRWRLPEKANTVRAADWFNYGRTARLERTAWNDAGAPGQAWFRHQLNEATRAEDLGLLWRSRSSPRPAIAPEAMEPRVKWVPRVSADPGLERGRNLDDRGDPFQLLGGGRAVSENLQLHRDLNVRPGVAALHVVNVAELKGIDVKEYDWSPSIAGLRPRLDPLAALIPADQHAVFFSDVPAAVAVMDELDRLGLAAFNLAETRGSNARIAERYMTQLGLPSAQLGKLLPPALIDNVGVTGSDLYFDIGTDTAVLLSSSKAGLVRQLVAGFWPVLKATTPDVVEREEEIGGVKCRVLRTPDRRICCYLAVVGDAVLLANSPAQVRRIAETKAGKLSPLSDAPEYTFFRDRYRIGESENEGFAIMTDAAIRRWCGPKWRIGHDRRIRAGAILADIQAAQLRSMHAGEARKFEDPRIGPVETGPHGAFSPKHGSRLFQTPIAESEIDQVTMAEADAYRRWRDSYQQNWSQFFDPIAIRIAVRPDSLAVDTTVIPLIMATEYRELVGLTTGARLAPGAGDPHPEAIAQFIMGFNRKNESFQKTIARYEGMIGQQFEIASWIGDWLTVYIDDDPVWEEFAKSSEPESEFWEKRDYRFPAAVGIAVADPKKHAEFVKKFRTLFGNFLRLEWTDATHKGVTYTRVRQKDQERGLQVWSLSLPDQWILSTSETVVRRAIERHLAPKTARRHVWPGDSLGGTVQPKAVGYLREWWGRSGVNQMQRAAWSNLPILNEWHGFGRVSDPVVFHEKWWGERLVEPAGGKYVWNADDGTMESTVFGHPGRPKGSRATLPAALSRLRGADLGVTFEKDGLRARIELAR
ncbi:MAG: hypothetical protein U0791_00875 [Gemmataceae bacterium]